MRPCPVIYGRQRTGGQLLSSSVDQTLTVFDDGVSSRRITAISAPATLSLLLALGEGPVSTIDPATIQINGQPIANFPGVQVWTNLGSRPPNCRSRRLAKRPIRLPMAGSLPGGLACVYTTTEPIEAFVLNIVFNQGLYAFSSRGEKVDNLVTSSTTTAVPAGAWSGWYVL